MKLFVCTHPHLVEIFPNKADSIGAGISASTASCLATLMANLMLYATAQIRILKDSLKNLGESEMDELDDVEETNSIKDHDTLYKNLSDCVQHHIAIIR